MVGIIGSTVSSLISRISGASETSRVSAPVETSETTGNVAGELRDTLELSDEALARLEDGDAALELARSIPSQLEESSIEFNQARLGELENRLGVLSSFDSPAREGLLDQLTAEVVGIARNTLADFPNFSLSDSSQSLEELLAANPLPA